MQDYTANRAAISEARARGFTGSIAATSPCPDEVRKLERAGVDLAIDIMAETGAGFAGDLLSRVDPPGQSGEGAADAR